MKRILLLIVLVMVATFFLRGLSHEEVPNHPRPPILFDSSQHILFSHEEVPNHRRPVEGSRLQRARAPKPPRSLLRQASEKVQAVDAEWVEASAPAPVDRASRTISSGMMATEERARADAIRKLGEEVSLWLEPEIPTDWKPSQGVVRSLIRETTYTPVVKDYGTLYVAELTADTSARRRDAIVATYHREKVNHRMLALGGSLAFVLVCLGAVSAYIRADEATKGYYTNRLRMLAAAGVGAAGVAVYRFI